MIENCNINNLAKNQVSAVFNSRAIRRSVSSKFIEICMEGTNIAAGNQQKTSVTEFCYKSVNSSLEKLKNNTFPYTRTRSDSQISRNKSLFNKFGRHVNAASRKSLEIQAWSIAKPRTHSEQKFV